MNFNRDEILDILDDTEIFSEDDFEWEEDDTLENPGSCDACN